MATASHRARMSVTSTSMYRANPAQTPAIFLLRLSSMSTRGGASVCPTAVRRPQRQQNRSSSLNWTPHCVQNISASVWRYGGPRGVVPSDEIGIAAADQDADALGGVGHI